MPKIYHLARKVLRDRSPEIRHLAISRFRTAWVEPANSVVGPAMAGIGAISPSTRAW
jgi:hypothetical protein